ncbi:MAG: ABC transporter substrate-binding protein [bacterium]
MTTLRLGFMPLVDCAVLAVAEAKGFFRRQGLDVVLSREPSWATLRDKLAADALDGAQLLAGMPLACAAGIDPVATPTITAFSLSLNGNAISVSRELWARMATAAPLAVATPPITADALRAVIAADRHAGRAPLRLAMVYPFATHNYELRYWLAAAGIDPDADVRDRGARLIVIDPRLTPIARTADLFLPVKPGRDSALMNAILHAVIRLGGVDRDFVDAHTTGFDDLCKTVEQYAPERVEALVGVPAARIIEAAEQWVQAPRTMLLHARGIEHHTKGVDNVLSCINLVLASGKIGKPGCGYATITGQGNGQGAREHGQRCNQLPGARDIENPAHRAVVAERWGVPVDAIPGKGATAPQIVEKIAAGEIRGLLALCFNPMVSLPDAAFTRAALERLDFFVAIDFFMSETARHADLILPGSLQEEDEGTVTSTEGRVIRIRQAVRPPGEAQQDWKIICGLAKRLGHEEKFRFEAPVEIFDELRALSQGGTADYAGITYEKIDRQMGVIWPCPAHDHSGTPRLFGGGRFNHPDGKARFHPVEYRPPAEDVDADYPIILTTGRVVSQFLSGNQTRRIGPLVEQQPEPLLEMHPRLAARLGIADGERVRVASRRGALELAAHVVETIRPDTVFMPYHWPGERSANRLTVRAYDPVSGIPEFKVAAVRIEKLVLRAVA